MSFFTRIRSKSTFNEFNGQESNKQERKEAYAGTLSRRNFVRL